MDVLIVEDDLPAQAALAQEAMRRGLGVVCMADLDGADQLLRLRAPRAMILAEWVGGRLSHRLALLAECCRADIAVVLLTDRAGPDLDELADLMPAVQAVLCRRFAADAVGQILAGLLNPGAPARLRLAGAGALRAESRTPPQNGRALPLRSAAAITGNGTDLVAGADHPPGRDDARIAASPAAAGVEDAGPPAGQALFTHGPIGPARHDIAVTATWPEPGVPGLTGRGVARPVDPDARCGSRRTGDDIADRVRDRARDNDSLPESGGRADQAARSAFWTRGRLSAIPAPRLNLADLQDGLHSPDAASVRTTAADQAADGPADPVQGNAPARAAAPTTPRRLPAFLGAPGIAAPAAVRSAAPPSAPSAVPAAAPLSAPLSAPAAAPLSAPAAVPAAAPAAIPAAASGAARMMPATPPAPPVSHPPAPAAAAVFDWAAWIAAAATHDCGPSSPPDCGKPGPLGPLTCAPGSAAPEPAASQPDWSDMPLRAAGGRRRLTLG